MQRWIVSALLTGFICGFGLFSVIPQLGNTMPLWVARLYTEVVIINIRTGALIPSAATAGLIVGLAFAVVAGIVYRTRHK